jgi:hypothetical protein
MYKEPWLFFNTYNDGSTFTTNYYCINKYYSVTEMNKIWEKWYVQIINPRKVKNLLKISLFDAHIEHLPGLKIDDDKITNLITINDLQNITVLEIIGLFFINIDINLENHKIKFIDALQIRCQLKKINGLNELFNGIKKWATAKYLLKHNNTKWTKFDTSILYVSNKKPIFNNIDESDLIRIKLLGSSIYDKFNSYEKYLHLIIDEKYPDKDGLITKYSYWMETRKYPF